jgi:hypothetical protein
MGNPENIRAHLWAEHDWNRPFGATPDRVLREWHRQMSGCDASALRRRGAPC